MSWLSSNAFCFFVSGFQPYFTAFCRRCLSLVLFGPSSNFKQRTRLVGLPILCSESDMGDSKMDSSGFSFGICDRHNRFRYMSSTVVAALHCLLLAGNAMGTSNEACEFVVQRRLGRVMVMLVRLESVNTTRQQTMSRHDRCYINNWHFVETLLSANKYI